MREIACPTLDEITSYNAIAAAKRSPRKERLQGILQTISNSYQQYFDNAPNIGALQNAVLTDEQIEALVHAFEVDTKPLLNIRDLLDGNLNGAKCPFCGLSEAAGLDHYLPKEVYPEFSVLARNLVPACGKCNSLKSTLISNQEANVRAFLHPYYDTIPDAQFISATSNLDGNALTLSFSIFRPPGMTNPIFQHLRGHFTTLKLAERYRRMSFDHLGDILPTIGRWYGADENGANVSAELTNSSADFSQARGPNYWMAVLYRSLADNQNFCDGGFHDLI